MAGAKKTVVVLECEALGSRTFDVEHAERLLAMPDNGGWKLPENSKYQFCNGSISRRNTNTAERGEE